MSTIGKVQITIVFICPPELAAEGERIFASHAKWMEETHHKTGELAMLRYNVIKGPELENPFDPASKPTGNTMFVLDELYENQAGLDDHWKRAPVEWSDIGAFVEWGGKCKVVTAHNGVAIQGLW
ncbi:MAG TPA: hypothetical protein PKC29_06155 [Thermodesulfobacteriota bacterium]|nr:hypothetical protein [Thermodesulfobacteriota bacterium]